MAMRVLAGLAAALAAGTLALAALAWWWLDHPLVLQAPRLELSVEAGATPRQIAEAWVEAGVRTDARWLYAWFRASGQARRIRAGSYEIEAGITPRGLLETLVQGRERMQMVRILEGWTVKQMRRALVEAPGLRATTADWDDARLMQELGLPGVPAEGQFFPDTYAYTRGVSDLTVLRRAQRTMQAQLAQAWAGRAEGLPLATPQQALVLASIIEKETGQAADRGLVGAVFVNRLRIGMPLQSDPTVIYGLGDAFDGNLRKRDLQADTPFNTYTRGGLPPTPIALPGLASLNAALRPESSKALYFVARGDGSSVFSQTLSEHNRAVNRYQRGQP
jgi:UPF0755 protein